MDASVFEELNEGDDLFFAPADGAARGAAAVPACAGSSVEDSISQIKLRIKKATDDGDYDQLAPLAEQIKQLQARASEVSQASVVDEARAAPPPINPVQARLEATCNGASAALTLPQLRSGDHFSLFLVEIAGKPALVGQFDETEPYRDQ